MTMRRSNSTTTIDLTGPEGNAFALIGCARRAMRELDYDQVRIDEVIAEMTSADYYTLVDVFERELGEYFDIIVPDDWEEDAAVIKRSLKV